MSFKTILNYTVRPDALPKVVQAGVAEGLRAALLYWHEHYRPLHFMNQAAKRYGYQPRSGDDEPPRLPREKKRKDGSTYLTYRSNPHYSWRKRREQRHNLPLVWSGASARAAKQVRIDASARRGKLAFTGLPKYFFMYLKAGQTIRRWHGGGGGQLEYTIKKDQPKKFKELVIVIPEEAAQLAKVTDQTLGQHVSQAMAGSPPAA